MNDGKLMYGIYLIFIEVLRDRKFSWARDVTDGKGFLDMFNCEWSMTSLM